MKKLLSFILVLVLCFSFVGCKEDKGEEKSNKERETAVQNSSGGEGPILYKVEKDGTTVWILGSIHVATEDMYPLPDYILDAFDAADALAVECNVNDKSNTPDLKTQMKILYTDGTSISDHISEELYEKSVSIMKDLGLYNKLIDKYRPIYWHSAITSAMTEEFGYDSDIGIDVTLIEEAEEADKEILEIESVTFQFNMQVSFSDEIQEMLLESAVSGYGTEEAEEELEEMVECWINGDEEKLVELITSEEGATKEQKKLLKEYNQIMLYDRNEGMADFIIDALEEDEDVFVCVGAAHVVGEDGIVDLLRKAGYIVTRV